MTRKNERDFSAAASHRSHAKIRTKLILAVPGLLLLVAILYRPFGHALGWFILLLFDWCLLQSFVSVSALGIALFRRQRGEIDLSLYSLVIAALPLVVANILSPHHRR